MVAPTLSPNANTSASVSPLVKNDLFAGITKDDINHAVDSGLKKLAKGGTMKDAAEAFLCSLTVSAIKNYQGAHDGNYHTMASNAKGGPPNLNVSVLYGAASAIFETGMNISMGADPGKEFGALVGRGMASQPSLDKQLSELFRQTWKANEVTAFHQQGFEAGASLGGAGSSQRADLFAELNKKSF